MKSLNKGFFFILLVVGLAGILIIRSDFFRFNSSLKLEERLPESDYLVRLNSLQFSRELSPILFKYNLPVREFASPDFLLSQAKHHGINIQSPAYLFFNSPQDEWGALIQVNDSSKIINAIDRFRKNTTVLDSSKNDARIFHFKELNLVIAYEKSYLFMYSGTKFMQRLTEVQQAKSGVIRKAWKHFLSKKEYLKEHVVVYSESPTITGWGFDYALFAHDNDTTDIRLKCYLHTASPHGIALNKNGLGLPISEKDSKSIELHLLPGFKKTPTGQLLIRKLNDLGSKISFPTFPFFEAWDGDLSFREGGVVNSTQRIVTTEFDEDFNAHDVIKYEKIQVPGYTVAFNTNNEGKNFINSLFAKGLLRSEENKLRFLFSPLLMINHQLEYYYFTSSSTFPVLVKQPNNQLSWNYDGTPYTMNFGRISSNSIELFVRFPAKPLIKLMQRKKYKRKTSPLF